MKPSESQRRTLIPFIKGRDLIVEAGGYGKKGAIAMGLLQRIDFENRCIQAIVISPTEDTTKIQQLIVEIGKFRHQATDHFCETFVEHNSIDVDIQNLQNGDVIVAVGTAERISLLLQRGEIKMESLKTVVIFRADELLFSRVMDYIHSSLSSFAATIQVVLFSHYIYSIDELTKFTHAPVIISLMPELTLTGIKQFYVNVDEGYKLETLLDLFEAYNCSCQSVIFCNMSRKVEWIADQLNKTEFPISCLHSRMCKRDRIEAVKTFRSGSTTILMTTDLCRGGYDVRYSNLVINYDVPANPSLLLNRIGRWGAFGRKGMSIIFVAERDQQEIRNLETYYDTQIDELPMNFADDL
jgi:translation initiation factor 4A